MRTNLLVREFPPIKRMGANYINIEIQNKNVADTEKQLGTVVIQHKIVILAPRWQTKHS